MVGIVILRTVTVVVTLKQGGMEQKWKDILMEEDLASNGMRVSYPNTNGVEISYWTVTASLVVLSNL